MKKKLKIIIPVILILILAVFAILYFVTDLFKSPKTLFFKYMGKAFETEEKYTYDNFLEELKFYYEKANTSEFEISIDANVGDDVEGIEELKKVKLSLLSQVGPKQESAYSKSTLYYNNDAITSVEYLNSNNNYGLKCADIYKNYFYIENSNLKELFEKFGIDSTNMPDSIEKINVYDLLCIDEKTRDSIVERYSELLDSELDKKNFSVEKGTEVKVNGKKVKANAYTLTMDAEDLCKLLIATVDTLKDDDELIDLVIEKLEMVSGDYEELQLSKDDIKETLENTLEELENSLDLAKEASGKIKLTVYEKGGKAVKVSLKSQDTVIALDITRNKKDGEICLYGTEDGDVIFSISNKYTVTKDTTEGTITIEAEDGYTIVVDYTYENSDENISLFAKLTLEDSTIKRDSEYVFTSTKQETLNVAIELKFETTGQDLQDLPTDVKYTGYVKLIEDTEDKDSEYVTVNFNGSSKYTDSVDIPNLNTSNGMSINTMTEADLELIKPDINTNINAFIDKTLPKFNLTREDIGLTAEPIDVFQLLTNMSTDISTSIDANIDYDYNHISSTLKTI